MKKPDSNEPSTGQATAAAEPPIAPASNGRLAGFDALKVPAYQWYSACVGLQQAAESMKTLANGWFAFELTGSTAILGLTLLAQAIPQTLLSFFGGVISDRFPRHRVWQVCNFAALMLPLWMAASIFLGVITWQYLVIQSFLFGIVVSFRAPARQGIMTEVVGRESIMSAVSLNQMISNILQFVGPAAAGFLIGWAGIQWTYLAMAAFYVFAILSLMPMKYERRNTSLKKGSRGSVFENIKDGLKYVGHTPDVRAVMGLTLLAGMFAMPYNQLLPAFGKTVLHTTPAMLGLLSSLAGIGALTGSLGITLIRPKVRGALLIPVVFFTGVGLVAFCLSNSYVLSGAIVLVVGIGQALRQTVASALIQTYTENTYLGRVLSINFTQNGLSTTASFAVAIGAQAIGIRYAVLTTSLLLMGVGALYWVFSRRLRRLA
ncbi:MAG: MFS transporter [Dehalococcoidia bacterium]|nr:MFS transporter [Dehalococcoidia bacterium]